MDLRQNNTAIHHGIRPSIAWLALTVAIFAVYRDIARHDFVNFDDPMFLFENSHVTSGLTIDGLRWAWTNKDAVLWQPLAWMGHMAISAVAGMRPAPHLLANLGLHVLNAGLLFTLLRLAIGAAGRSFAVALLFAVHPVNVETVAWASQLKSTLSTFFFLLGLLAYVRDKRAGKEMGYDGMAAFALSLLAKPMLLFFPLVLALLDYWPLQKLPHDMDRGAWNRWLMQKLPFVLLAGVMLAMTVVPWTTAAAADVAPMQFPDGRRLLAIPSNYTGYLGLMFWPVDLAVLYPERLDHPVWATMGSVGLLVVISVIAWRTRGRLPALLVGWTWFLITMIPASGLLRAGQHGLADRYLYVPGIGLFFALIWSVADLLAASRLWAKLALLSAIVLLLGRLAYDQVAYWSDSVSLWRHAVAVTPPSAVGHVNLGNALLGAARDREAEAEFTAAIELEKNDPRPYVNLAVIAQHQGNDPKAIAILRHALMLAPTDARIYSNLGSLLDDTGEQAEARLLLEKAVQLRPELEEAWLNLGVLWAHSGELERALACFETAARLKPGNPSVISNLQLVKRQIQASRSGISR